MYLGVIFFKIHSNSQAPQKLATPKTSTVASKRPISGSSMKPTGVLFLILPRPTQARNSGRAKPGGPWKALSVRGGRGAGWLRT